MTNALPIGSKIGILGGGQLGRMLSVAAGRLGFETVIFEPGANPPAGHLASHVFTAAYSDQDALTQFANAVDVITYEFENIPAKALDIVEAITPVRPGRPALTTSQDRMTEKDFLNSLGLKTAAYAQVDTLDDLLSAVETIGRPSILKTRRMGYDGKGQVRLTPDTDLAQAWEDVGAVPCVLEGFIPYTKEISIIAARSADGQVACYDPGENIHKDGILHTTTVPADIPASLRMDAALLAGQILNRLDYVGVMGVELFVAATGLIVNEIAPRVHNSGHWTQNGCDICQFEQHIRAIAGWALGGGSRHSDIRMENLIGDDINRIPDLATDGHAIHLYGKSDAKPGRKMGHVNIRLPK
ncbi:MAG: 5-(carboxyamino)imidazole ribonucleotide synthase [Planktomarina sp.]